MTSYNGKAKLQNDSGQAVPVIANLFSLSDPNGGQSTWGGRVRTDSDDDLGGMLGETLTIQIGPRSGGLIMTSLLDGNAEVQGTGDAPF